MAHALRVVTKPGDEVITFAPYFPEYQPYVNGTGAHLTVVPADTENFQINFDAFEKALEPRNRGGAHQHPEQSVRRGLFR